MALRARIKPQSRDAVMRRLREVVPEIDDKLADAQRRAAEDLASAIKARAPSLSGEYRNSIEAAKLSEIDYRQTPGIATTKDPNAYGIKALYIWRFIEFGSRAHIIKARKKPKLAFSVGGRLIRTAQVSHPGTKPQPHIFPTYRAMKKRIRRRIAAAVNKALKGIGHNGGPSITD